MIHNVLYAISTIMLSFLIGSLGDELELARTMGSDVCKERKIYMYEFEIQFCHFLTAQPCSQSL